MTTTATATAYTEPRNARKFCDVLRDQADKALAAGEISRREHRMVGVFSRLRPRKTREVMEFVQEQALAAGLPGAVGDLEAIDWEGFADFIERILPMIIEFIQALMLIFGGL